MESAETALRIHPDKQTSTITKDNRFLEDATEATAHNCLMGSLHASRDADGFCGRQLLEDGTISMIETANLDVTGLPFDIAINELELIIKKLEQVDAGTAESRAIYERGEALKARCEQLMDQELESSAPPC